MPPRKYNLDASSILETPVKCLNDGFLEDDSGYKGQDTTPRYHKKRLVSKTKLSFTPHLSVVKEKASTLINSEDKILLAIVPYRHDDLRQQHLLHHLHRQHGKRRKHEVRSSVK